MTWFHSPGVAYVCAGDAYFLARATDGEILALEASAALLWDAVEGNDTAQIVALLRDWVGQEIPASDVETGLQNLLSEGLIVDLPADLE